MFVFRTTCQILVSTAAMALALITPIGCAQAATAPEFKRVRTEVIAEPGCPIVIGASPRAQFEMDTSGYPVAAREYISYKNVSAKTITAIKVRIGFVGEDGMATVFQGSDEQTIPPNGIASQKWRTQVGSQARGIKLRVLAVKFDDGTTWQSEKITASGRSVEFAEVPDPSNVYGFPHPPRQASQPKAHQPSPEALLPPAQSEQIRRPADTGIASVPPPPPVPEDVFPI